jgi:predicted urease superfamily metal-dependent hydrolase
MSTITGSVNESKSNLEKMTNKLGQFMKETDIIDEMKEQLDMMKDDTKVSIVKLVRKT